MNKKTETVNKIEALKTERAGLEAKRVRIQSELAAADDRYRAAQSAMIRTPEVSADIATVAETLAASAADYRRLAEMLDATGAALEAVGRELVTAQAESNAAQVAEIRKGYEKARAAESDAIRLCQVALDDFADGFRAMYAAQADKSRIAGELVALGADKPGDQHWRAGYEQVLIGWLSGFIQTVSIGLGSQAPYVDFGRMFGKSRADNHDRAA